MPTVVSSGRYTPTNHRAPGPRSRHPKKSPSHPNKPLSDDPELLVRPWIDPLLDHVGIDPRSSYVERFWLPIIGPSATLLLRRLVAELEEHPKGFTLTPLLWAEYLGLSAYRGGAHGPFGRALGRTTRFDLTLRSGDSLLVRRRIPRLSGGQLVRLPKHIRHDHDRWTVRQQSHLRPTPDCNHSNHR